MLSRLSPSPTFDRLAKATLIATAASLLVGGGLIGARVMAKDSCGIAVDGLDTHARMLVARRTLACNDYEHGRITKQQYQDAIATIDLDFSRPAMRSAERLWATSVLGFSTQYSDTSWSAQQALGRPNVFPRHGDIAQAWASKGADDHDEWIELGYDNPRAVSAVEIYETFNPGAIESIELITTTGRRIELRPPSPAELDEVVEVNRLVVETQCTSEPIAAVRVNVVSQDVVGWNEIDAVGLVPCTERPTARIP